MCMVDVFPFLDPRNNEFGSEELAESVKEEKKRKKMEAIAEDLFNNEKVRIVTVFFSPGFDLMIYP